MARGAGQAPLAKQARAVAKNSMPTRALQQQASALISPLTRQEEAILEYAHTLANPWIEDPSGVPLILGSGTVRTNKAQLIWEQQVTNKNAGEVAFIVVSLDGWCPTGSDSQDALPYQFGTYQGGTNGNFAWYSGAAAATGGTTFPVANVTPANMALAGINALPIPMKVLDGTVNANTGVRLVAAGLRVFSDAAVNTAQGKLCVVATSAPLATSATGGIAGATYAQLSGMPQDLVSFQTAPCAGWKSGSALHVVAIPNSPVAFQFLNPPAAGFLNSSYPQLGAMLSGGAAGQTFTAQIVLDYEFTFSFTNVTGVADDPVYNAGPGAVSQVHSSMMQGGLTTSGPLAKTNGKNPLGVQSFVSQVHNTMPGRAPEILKIAKIPGEKTNNWGTTLSKVAHSGLDLISKVAPSWLGTAANVGKGILNFFGI
jgi:hypothetical protein